MAFLSPRACSLFHLFLLTLASSSPGQETLGFFAGPRSPPSFLVSKIHAFPSAVRLLMYLAGALLFCVLSSLWISQPAVASSLSLQPTGSHAGPLLPPIPTCPSLSAHPSLLRYCSTPHIQLFQPLRFLDAPGAERPPLHAATRGHCFGFVLSSRQMVSLAVSSCCDEKGPPAKGLFRACPALAPTRGRNATSRVRVALSRP